MAERLTPGRVEGLSIDMPPEMKHCWDTTPSVARPRDESVDLAPWVHDHHISS